MGLFGFGKSKDAAPVSALPPLSPAEAERLTQMVCDHVQSLGLVVLEAGDGVVKTDRSVLGLHNLAQNLYDIPEEHWPDRIETHLRVLLGALERVKDTVEPEQVYLKLRCMDDIPDTPSYDAKEVLPGVWALLAIDYPDSVSESLGLEGLGHLGDWGALQEIAMKNIRSLPLPEYQATAGNEDQPDSLVHIFFSEDFFGASRFLILDELMKVFGVDKGQHGIFVAVPNRHILLVHVLEGPGVIDAVGLMASITHGESASSGPVSSSGYYISPEGEMQTVLDLDESGNMRMMVEGVLADQFVELGLLGNS